MARLLVLMGKTYRIDVKLDGSEIKVAVDDELVLEVADASLTAGTVGLYTKGSELVIFGDVTVNGVAADIPIRDDDNLPDDDIPPVDDDIVPDDDLADDDVLETGSGGGCFLGSATR